MSSVHARHQQRTTEGGLHHVRKWLFGQMPHRPTTVEFITAPAYHDGSGHPDYFGSGAGVCFPPQCLGQPKESTPMADTSPKPRPPQRTVTARQSCGGCPTRRSRATSRLRSESRATVPPAALTRAEYWWSRMQLLRQHSGEKTADIHPARVMTRHMVITLRSCRVADSPRR